MGVSLYGRDFSALPTSEWVKPNCLAMRARINPRPNCAACHAQGVASYNQRSGNQFIFPTPGGLVI